MARLEKAIGEATSSESLHREEKRVAELQAERAELEARVDERRDWRFPDPTQRWWHDELARLVGGLEALRDGLLADDAVSEEHGWSIPKRLAFAERLRSAHASGGELARAWEPFLLAFHEDYPSIALTPQIGLVPLGKDPRSNLWEFADLETGTPPVRGQDGALVIREESAVVLVLLPGGTFSMGAQSLDPKAPLFDPAAAPDEGPPHEVKLSPYFLAKHELTQAQWQRITGVRPSRFGPGDWGREWNRDEPEPGLTHPVERVSWRECELELWRLGLALPTEAQWEFAARGGSAMPWWFGADPARLVSAGNVADARACSSGLAKTLCAEWDDGAGAHLPVDAQEPNPFGFAGMLGNVWEWCADGYDSRTYRSLAGLDPLEPPNPAGERARRGGSYASAYTDSRSASRGYADQDSRLRDCGLRPARALERR
jgi:formylglycine-generating enzyme required for sulfatase activity